MKIVNDCIIVAILEEGEGRRYEIQFVEKLKKYKNLIQMVIIGMAIGIYSAAIHSI